MLLKEEGVASASLLYGERIRSELGSSKGLMQEGKKLCHHKSLVCGYLGTLLLNKIYRVHAKMHLRQAENSKGGSEPRARASMLELINCEKSVVDSSNVLLLSGGLHAEAVSASASEVCSFLFAKVHFLASHQKHSIAYGTTNLKVQVFAQINPHGIWTMDT